MNKILVFTSFLRTVQDGRLFNRGYGWLVRILSLLTVIPLIKYSVDLWSTIRGSEPPVEIVVFLILTQIVFLALFYLLLNLLWVRGSDILGLTRDLEYCATPIIVLLMKTVTETVVFILLAVSLITTFAIWLAPMLIGLITAMAPFMMYFGLRLTSSPFLNGMLVLILGAVSSFFLLLLGYYLAEITGALVSVARSLGSGSNSGSGSSTASRSSGASSSRSSSTAATRRTKSTQRPLER